MKKDFLLPIISLSCICLFVSGILAAVNIFTKPEIEKKAQERAELAMKNIIPHADKFIKVDHPGEIPKSVTDIYKTSNNVGYIFMIKVQGYGGDLKLFCGINNDGVIIKVDELEHTETKGMTDPVFRDPHESQYIGKDKNLHFINAVTGATISSNAYKRGIQDAFTAYWQIINNTPGTIAGEEICEIEIPFEIESEEAP